MAAKLTPEEVDNNVKKVEAEVSEAMLELGKKYYDANREGGSSEFSDDIKKISNLMEKTNLWTKYRLSLDGKILCESCGAAVTDDSLFCNKCGSKVTKPDFSVLNIMSEEPAPELPEESEERLCPNCGRKLLPNAKFCEKCGKPV